MQIEPIDEPVAVQATHHTGRVSPERFVWRGRIYPVETVNGQWEDRDGLYRRFHFSVQAFLVIAIDHKNGQSMLIKIGAYIKKRNRPALREVQELWRPHTGTFGFGEYSRLSGKLPV